MARRRFKGDTNQIQSALSLYLYNVKESEHMSTEFGPTLSLVRSPFLCLAPDFPLRKLASPLEAKIEL